MPCLDSPRCTIVKTIEEDRNYWKNLSLAAVVVINDLLECGATTNIAEYQELLKERGEHEIQ
jgi:hypothetical protein